MKTFGSVQIPPFTDSLCTRTEVLLIRHWRTKRDPSRKDISGDETQEALSLPHTDAAGYILHTVHDRANTLKDTSSIRSVMVGYEESCRSRHVDGIVVTITDCASGRIRN